METVTAFISDLWKGRRLGTLRTLVQGAFAAVTLYAGYRFYLFYLWGVGRSDYFVSRPPSVEGFLPIGALVGLKRLVVSGQYDMIHPAGLTIFIAALVIAFAARKGFCGWICPVGFASNLAEKAGRKLKILWRPSPWLDIPLLSLKYILLFLFIYLIVVKMTPAQIEEFHSSPYNLAVDAKMLLFFLSPSGLSAAILLFLTLISFVIRNFWCRYLCPYGALLGIIALFSPQQIRRDEATCIDCGKCERVCPGSIRITWHRTVRTAECVGCGQCTSVCPVPDCLRNTVPVAGKVSSLFLPAVTVGIFLLIYLAALVTGHWYSEIPPEVLKEFYMILAELPHPGV